MLAVVFGVFGLFQSPIGTEKTFTKLTKKKDRGIVSIPYRYRENLS